MKISDDGYQMRNKSNQIKYQEERKQKTKLSTKQTALFVDLVSPMIAQQKAAVRAYLISSINKNYREKNYPQLPSRYFFDTTIPISSLPLHQLENKDKCL